MKHGFVKVRCFSPDLRVADIKFNTAKIIQAIWDSHERGVKLLALPELCVSACTCGDLFLQEVLIDACENAIEDIRKASEGKDLIAFVGAPLKNGDSLYSCSVAICNGKILGVVPKRNLVNYPSSLESRYFASSVSRNEIKIADGIYPFGYDITFECSSLGDLKIAVSAGQDAFLESKRNATVVVCPFACCEIVGADSHRELMLRAKSSENISAYLLANACEDESTTDSIYSANNIVCENGKVIAKAKPFESKNGDIITEIDVCALASLRAKAGRVTRYSDCIKFDLEVTKTEITRKIARNPFVCEDREQFKANLEKILTMQSRALAKRLVASHSSSMVMGISGGLDSTLALLVCVRTLEHLGWDKKRLFAITMPCFGTTKRTKSNAVSLCEELGVALKEINIADAVRVHFKDIGHDESVQNVTYENAQARERTQILMDFANDNGGLVVGTGDLSEIALGWSTYNADHMSMYNPNCDIPKTLVRHLVAYEASLASGRVAEILYDVLDTPVSPELLPPTRDEKIQQKTEDLVGPYDLHDFFLYYFVKYGFAPSKIYRLAKIAFKGEFSDEIIHKWLEAFIKRFFTQQFKRSCSPDGVKVGSVALSPRTDMKMPSDATYWSWLDELNSNKDY